MQVMSDDVSPTLREQMKHHEPIVCYSEKRFFEWHEDEKCVSLRAASGSYGGGSETLVCTKERSEHCAKRITNGFSNNKLNKGN